MVEVVSAAVVRVLVGEERRDVALVVLVPSIDRDEVAHGERSSGRRHKPRLGAMPSEHHTSRSSPEIVVIRRPERPHSAQSSEVVAVGRDSGRMATTSEHRSRRGRFRARMATLSGDAPRGASADARPLPRRARGPRRGRQGPPHASAGMPVPAWARSGEPQCAPTRPDRRRRQAARHRPPASQRGGRRSAAWRGSAPAPPARPHHEGSCLPSGRPPPRGQRAVRPTTRCRGVAAHPRRGWPLRLR